VDWCGFHGSVVHDRQVADRCVHRQREHRFDLWGGGIAGGRPGLDLLLVTDPIFWRGINPGLCQILRFATHRPYRAGRAHDREGAYKARHAQPLGTRETTERFAINITR